jgi:small conductance mechanosensitive channel
MNSDLEKYVDMAIQIGMGYGPKLVLAILTLIIGLWIINSVGRRLSKSFEKVV